MNVLITGIDGFTGSHLESFLLTKGFDVYGTVIEESHKANHLKCDIRNKEEVDTIINRVKPEFVFHLAAISFVGETDTSLIYDVNVQGTKNLLDSLSKLPFSPQKIIIASSATVYGNQESAILDESMIPNPVNDYGHSKLAMEHMVETYFQKLNIIITRPFNYTGPHHSKNFIIPKIVSHFSNNETSIELGNINVSREFNDIRTVIDMYYKLMLSSVKSEIVNLCTGNVISLKEVIEQMQQLAGYTIEIKVNPAFVRQNEIPVLKGSVSKLNSLISVENIYTLKDTLISMYHGEQND